MEKSRNTKSTRFNRLFATVFAAITIITLAMFSCDTAVTPDAVNNLQNQIQTVATPTATPAGGEVASGTAVELATVTDGATVYYTTDGGDPATVGAPYESAIIISADTTLKAIAKKADWMPSGVISAQFALIIPAPPPENEENEEEIEEEEEEVVNNNTTAKLTLAETAKNTSGTSGSISSDGITLTLNVVEEPAAYFALLKTADQTITVSGTDAGKVTQVTANSGDTELDGSTATATKDLFKVNMEDLLFDGAFGESETFNANVIPSGMETRTFTLTVAEPDKDSREIAVSLNITLDQGTETSIYHREGEPGAYHYVKVRNAVLPATDIVNADFIAFTEGSVKDLQNAFIWVDRYGLGGSGHAGFAEGIGTTEGYSEYRLFLKKSQKIGKLSFLINGGGSDTRDNISMEFLGQGPLGKEMMITLDEQYSSRITNQHTQSKYKFNDLNGGVGWITLHHTGTAKYKALVLEKNITINGEEYPVTGTNESIWKLLGSVVSFINVHKSSQVIMRDGSKITGFLVSVSNAVHAPVQVDKTADGMFYMYGGAITGNVIEKGAIRAKNALTTGPVYIKGGTISNKKILKTTNSTKVTAY
jgi:hypothetical protein